MTQAPCPTPARAQVTGLWPWLRLRGRRAMAKSTLSAGACLVCLWHRAGLTQLCWALPFTAVCSRAQLSRALFLTVASFLNPPVRVSQVLCLHAAHQHHPCLPVTAHGKHRAVSSPSPAQFSMGSGVKSHWHSWVCLLPRCCVPWVCGEARSPPCMALLSLGCVPCMRLEPWHDRRHAQMSPEIIQVTECINYAQLFT